jgi:hypothetical protein
MCTSTSLQDLHPERLHRAIVYPTGIVFYSMWNLLVKWFMAESTREKVGNWCCCVVVLFSLAVWCMVFIAPQPSLPREASSIWLLVNWKSGCHCERVVVTGRRLPVVLMIAC